MKKYSFISILTALVLPLTLTSCKLRSFKGIFKESNSSETSTTKTESGGKLLSGDCAPSVSDVRSHVEALLKDLKVSDNAEALQKDIDTLVYDVNACSEAMSLAMIEYYSNWHDDSLGSKYDTIYEDLYVCTYFADYAFAKGYASKEYSELFKPYIHDEESVESLTASGMSLKRLEGYARVDYDVMDEQLDAYYDIVEDSSLSNDEKNLKCAELYLDVLSGCDPDTFYESFNRDYSPEDILELSKTVREKLIPAEKKLYDAFKDSDKSGDIISAPKKFDAPFDVILEYSAKLSPDIEKAAKLITDEKLFTLNKGTKCYTGSFTDKLLVSNKPHIYIYDFGDYNSLSTPVHEFGHFYALTYDDTPIISTVPNMDIAEVQSQGFEFIFSRFFDDIYGEDSEAMHALKTCDMLDAAIAGFLIGEFEYTVLKDRDTMTPEDVVECFHDIFDDYNSDAEFYFVPHIFEQPGYYISYGVSALAAFDIWQDSIYAPDEALEKYEKIAHISSRQKSSTFTAALKECGFSDVLNKKYIEVLAEEINDYADEFSGS